MLEKRARIILESIDPEHDGVPAVNLPFIMAILQDKLRKSREKWWEAQPKFLATLNPPRYENMEEVAARLESRGGDRLSAASDRSRRHRVRNSINTLHIQSTNLLLEIYAPATDRRARYRIEVGSAYPSRGSPSLAPVEEARYHPWFGRNVNG